MTTFKNKKLGGVVSVKLNENEKEELEKEAKQEGITISDLLRKKLAQHREMQTKLQNTNNTYPTGQHISAESLNSIDKIVAEKVNSLKAIPPERDYLKKIASKEPENINTLTLDEEKYLNKLMEVVKAECVEDLLLEHNSVPIFLMLKNEMQIRIFGEMVKKRNEVVSEKLPSFNQLFSKSISSTFFEDCNSLYYKNLFKSTYGITYDEFRAVFFDEN